MMHFGIKDWISFIIGLAVIVFGLLPTLGIKLISVPGQVWLGILLAALVFLIIDGFGEEHLLKTITLVCGLLIGLYLAIPMANSVGWVPFNIPNMLFGLEGYVHGLCGALLIIGSFKV